MLTATGKEYKGDIQRLDFDRDLALIKIQGRQGNSVPLEMGRNILNLGEKVYSTGCSANKRGAIFAGTINGSPRLVGQHPLWQVFMEINPGHSGSAVFDEYGAIVAVIKGRYRGTGSMGFLIPLDALELPGLHPRIDRSEIPPRELVRVLERPGEKAAAQGAVGDEADAELPAGVEDLPLRVPASTANTRSEAR